MMCLCLCRVVRFVLSLIRPSCAGIHTLIGEFVLLIQLGAGWQCVFSFELKIYFCAREFVDEADKASMRIYEHLQVSLALNMA
jgi:hypothetical protein